MYYSLTLKRVRLFTLETEVWDKLFVIRKQNDQGTKLCQEQDV